MTGPQCRGPLVALRRFTAALSSRLNCLPLFGPTVTDTFASFLPAGFYLPRPVALRAFPCPSPSLWLRRPTTVPQSPGFDAGVHGSVATNELRVCLDAVAAVTTRVYICRL